LSLQRPDESAKKEPQDFESGRQNLFALRAFEFSAGVRKARTLQRHIYCQQAKLQGDDGGHNANGILSA